MTMLSEADRLYSRDEYYRWREGQPNGRFERIAGQIVAMAPERAAHLRLKAAMWLVLRTASKAAGVPCEALPDGATIATGESDYEPDAIVNCGEPMDANAIVATNPVVVVEVLSPSTQSTDTGGKLAGYFAVPSIFHYLIVHTTRRMIIHHRRRDDSAYIETRLLAAGPINLRPPGITIHVEDVYETWFPAELRSLCFERQLCRRAGALICRRCLTRPGFRAADHRTPLPPARHCSASHARPRLAPPIARGNT